MISRVAEAGIRGVAPLLAEFLDENLGVRWGLVEEARAGGQVEILNPVKKIVLSG